MAGMVDKLFSGEFVVELAFQRLAVRARSNASRIIEYVLIFQLFVVLASEKLPVFSLSYFSFPFIYLQYNVDVH
jgi:hypothetical protein